MVTSCSLVYTPVPVDAVSRRSEICTFETREAARGRDDWGEHGWSTTVQDSTVLTGVDALLGLLQ